MSKTMLLAASLLAASFSTTIRGAVRGSRDYNFIVNTPEIGPFNRGQSNYMMPFTLRKYSTQTVFFQIIVRCQYYRATDDSLLESYNVPFTLYELENTTNNITFPCSRLSDEGFKVVITFMPTSYERYNKAYTFYLYPRSTAFSQYNVNNYRNSTLTRNITSFRFMNGNFYKYAESFTFNDSYSRFVDEYYYRISLDQFSFAYSFSQPFAYSSAVLYIHDMSLHPNLPKHYETSKTMINLSAYTVGNTVKLRPAINLYVNTMTLEMATSPINSDYIQTEYIYLPINKREQAKNSNYSINIRGIGINNTNLYWFSSLDSDRYYFGKCSESDYCLKGGVYE